jgi:hypothetical protein
MPIRAKIDGLGRQTGDLVGPVYTFITRSPRAKGFLTITNRASSPSAFPQQHPSSPSQETLAMKYCFNPCRKTRIRVDKGAFRTRYSRKTGNRRACYERGLIFGTDQYSRSVTIPGCGMGYFPSGPANKGAAIRPIHATRWRELAKVFVTSQHAAAETIHIICGRQRAAVGRPVCWSS